MSASKEFVLDTMRKQGKAVAAALQQSADSMSGTQLNAEARYIPTFEAAKAAVNMLQRKVGFICKSPAGRVVRLLQPYDSDVYPDVPEQLSAQWGFVWSTDPQKALPFIALATSPYMAGDCCTEGEKVYRSTMDNNVFSPAAYPDGWEAVE